jgi:hypothetical protein
MARRNRTSLLKRQREAEKRARQAKRAAKAALKRERRVQKKADSQIAPGNDAEDNATLTEPSATATPADRNVPAPSSGANGDGTSVP